MKKITGILKKAVSCLRKNYYSSKRKKLENNSPSIIASDCFGTFVYHNLGLRFNSPTINLFFSKGDFFEFVTHLKEYLDSDVIRVSDDSVNYPVGRLERGDKSVRINFMHYKSFDEAREKWNERKKRVDFDNIYIISVIQDATEEDIKKFDRLDWKNKMLVTKENPTGSPNVKVLDLLKDPHGKPGAIFLYKNGFSLRRPMDEIDYTAFLNQ